MAISLNGSNQWVSVPYDTSYNFGLNPFAISFWMFQSTSSPGSMCRVNNQPVVPWLIGYNSNGLLMSSNGIAWDIIADVTAYGGASTGVWNHYVLSRPYPDFYCYKNGVQTHTFNPGSKQPQPVVADLSFGNYRTTNSPPTQDYLDGRLGDIRIYNRRLLDSEQQTIYESRGNDGIVNGMIGRWLLNENFSGQVMTSGLDLGTLSNDADPQSAPTYIEEPIKLTRSF